MTHLIMLSGQCLVVLLDSLHLLHITPPSVKSLQSCMSFTHTALVPGITARTTVTQTTAIGDASASHACMDEWEPYDGQLWGLHRK